MMQRKVWLLWKQHCSHLGKRTDFQDRFFLFFFDADNLNTLCTNKMDTNGALLQLESKSVTSGESLSTDSSLFLSLSSAVTASGLLLHPCTKFDHP